MGEVLNLIVANDIGNYEMEMQLKGQDETGFGNNISQPSIYKEINKRDITHHMGGLSTEELLKKPYNNIIVEINSGDLMGIYLVGNSSKADIKNRYKEYSPNRNKSAAPFAIINTIGMIGMYAITRAFEKNKEVVNDIEINCDMVTALPIKEYFKNPEIRLKFKDKFEKGNFDLIFHVGTEVIRVKMNFKRVCVLPEAYPANFSLIFDENGGIRNDDIFADFNEYYKDAIEKPIDGQYIFENDSLHIDNGGGTTDAPIIIDNLPDSRFTFGSLSIGINHVVKRVMESFNASLPAGENYQVHFLSDLLAKEPENARLLDYKEKLQQLVHLPLKNMAGDIIDDIVNEALFENMNSGEMAVKVIIVYGGGSILLDKYLRDSIYEVADDYDVKVLYIPAKYATKMNIDGLAKIAFINYGKDDSYFNEAYEQWIKSFENSLLAKNEG